MKFMLLIYNKRGDDMTWVWRCDSCSETFTHKWWRRWRKWVFENSRSHNLFFFLF